MKFYCHVKKLLILYVHEDLANYYCAINTPSFVYKTGFTVYTAFVFRRYNRRWIISTHICLKIVYGFPGEMSNCLKGDRHTYQYQHHHWQLQNCNKEIPPPSQKKTHKKRRVLEDKYQLLRYADVDPLFQTEGNLSCIENKCFDFRGPCRHDAEFGSHPSSIICCLQCPSRFLLF